jgi:MFS family permease
MFSSFVIALGYGVLLPVLPGLVAKLTFGVSQGSVVWHTGLLTATYAGSALLVAPILGRIADRSANSWVIVLSLVLTGIATIAGAFATSLSALYLWRLIAGLGAGAIGPSTQAWLGRWALADNSWRTRRVVWIGLASTAGLFIGPFVGGLSATIALGFSDIPELVQQSPFLVVGALLLAAAIVVAISVRRAPLHRQPELAVTSLLKRISLLLVPVGITAFAIGAFEVALAFMGNGQRMSPFEIGLLFAQCTLFMFAAQTFLIMPRFRDRSLRPLIVPALLILATGLITMAFVSGTALHMVSTGLVAIGGGLLPPVLTREISAIDGGATGAANGIQSAAGQAGATAGPVFASLIATITEPRWTFIAVAAAVLATGIFVFQNLRQFNWQRTAP